MTTRTYTPEEETRRELFMTAIAAAEKLASALDDLGIYNSIREGWKNYLLLESGLDSDHLGMPSQVRRDGSTGLASGMDKIFRSLTVDCPDSPWSTLINRVRRLDDGPEDD